MSWQPLADLGVLHRRAELLRQIRHFFFELDVVEVQTPSLGAASVTDPDVHATTVGTHYLQTSPEYFLKRLLAAGMSSCYQMAPAFRADEQGRLHNGEFTLLEWYRLGFDHHQLMAEVAQLVDLSLGKGSYRTVAYSDLVANLQVPRDVLDLEFALVCEKLEGRVFVVDYPADQAALARLNPQDPTTAARFELVVDGVELANGYWELLDAQIHRQRFQRDNEIRAQRGLPQQAIDEQFLSALEHGLPPCAGVALGVDRLVMAAIGANNIEDVLTFRD